MDDPSVTPNKWQRQQAPRNPDPRALLATYPMASVTPVMHAGRHLSTLTDVAPMPIYMQPQRVPGLVPDAFQDPNSRSRDYMERLSNSRMPTGGQERAFWDANQQQAAHIISQQASVYPQSSHPHHQGIGVQHHYYQPAFAPQQPPTPFAQSILSSVPFSSRQYPNGPSVSSINAQYPPPEDSPRFFREFLESKSKEMRESNAINPMAHRAPLSNSTPTPYDRSQGQHQMNNTGPRAMSISPQKRKAEGEHVHSPSMKRVQSNDHMNWSPMKSQSTSIPIPPSAATAHPNQIPYVAVPPVPIHLRATPVKNSGQPRYPLPSGSSTPATPTPRKNIDSDWMPESVYGDASSSAPVPPSTQSRAGDRDRHNSVDKLVSYLEDIFEAEDTLPADSPAEDSEAFDFFSKLTTDWSHPRLNTKVMNKLTKIVDQIAQPTKRARRDALFHSPGIPEVDGLASIETSTLSRIIKLLERSVTAGEDVDPFAGPIVRLNGSNSVADGPAK
ncbi:Sister chromatid cohesion protein 2, partial [Serendipita sp. 407]